MGHYRNKNNVKKYERWVVDSSGAARGALYKPYLCVQDVPSRGNVNRIKGWKSERVHHFMSNLEMQFFFMLEWSDAVIDINEQFPLDLAETPGRGALGYPDQNRPARSVKAGSAVGDRASADANTPAFTAGQQGQRDGPRT
jgi:hypothetical protein